MKGITIGIIEVYSDDGDGFDKLLEVAKESAEIIREDNWPVRLFNGIKKIFEK